MGECLPDPCLTMSCASFCMDGTCLDDNPCASVTCEHGCVRGLCLQNRNARGPDLDDDGYSDVADCDDGNALVHPGRMEVCGNGVDDNCDGFIDERPCGDGTGGPDSGTGGPDSGTGADSGGGVGPGLEEGGCGCGTAPGDEPAGGAAIALLVLASLLRRRRRPGHGRQ
ncbi:MAG: putative metal-binding motif-containing protein [Deltaproteobacteria bacterium]|nr:putative metal-binding motif-containing protein [Deltaproteobacteria bacterium]